MTHAFAKHYAAKIADWLRDEVTRAEIAGSIRRDRPTCNDIDIVCIPKIQESKDLFGTVVRRQNLVEYFLINYAGKNNRAILSNGPKQILIALPKCQLDLWFADEKTFATRLLCRTGSMQHNIWLAGRAKRQGKKWNPYEGILYGGKWRRALGGDEEYIDGQLVQEVFKTEADIYASLDLPFIEPKNREIEFLVKNFGQ
jgi:DNA polymerase/3'-5' exonuclease PolX